MDFIEQFKTANESRLKMSDGETRLKLLSEFLLLVPEEEFNICGWIACACGWGTKIFDGFQLENNEHDCFPFISHSDDEEYSGWNAVHLFFDLDSSEADHLFSHYTYPDNPTPQMVSERIVDFLANGVVYA